MRVVVVTLAVGVVLEAREPIQGIIRRALPALEAQVILAEFLPFATILRPYGADFDMGIPALPPPPAMSWSDLA